MDFSNADDCANAFDEMNNQEIDGRAVSINFSSGILLARQTDGLLQVAVTFCYLCTPSVQRCYITQQVVFVMLAPPV